VRRLCLQARWKGHPKLPRALKHEGVRTSVRLRKTLQWKKKKKGKEEKGLESRTTILRQKKISQGKKPKKSSNNRVLRQDGTNINVTITGDVIKRGTVKQIT